MDFLDVLFCLEYDFDFETESFYKKLLEDEETGRRLNE